VTGRVLKLDPAAHKVADALLPWFVNGTLDADELAFVERHVAECRLCKDEVEWLRKLYAACIAGEGSPEAAGALRKLRQRLEAPPPARRFRLPQRARPWTHWVIGAQLALILGLGALWLRDDESAARYRTLGAPGAASRTAGSLVVVFDPSAPEAELRRVLREADARVVDGPTRTSAYLLAVTPEGRDHALRVLRSERAVTLVEALDSPGPR